MQAKDMNVVVVGGGIIGLLAALELAEKGASVALFERGAMGGEASAANAGILSPMYPWRYPDEVNRLAIRSQFMFPQIASDLFARTGVDPQWIRSGLLILEQAEGGQAAAWSLLMRDLAKSLGHPWDDNSFGPRLEEVDEGQARELEPALAAGAGAGIWMPNIAQVRTPSLVNAAKQRLRQLEVRLHEKVEVTGFLEEGERVAGVQTANGEFRASHVLVAAGAWTGELLRRLGAEVPVVPVRGQTLLFRGRPELLTRMVLREGYYVVPRRDGRILAGSTHEERHGVEHDISEEARAELREAALAMVPALADLETEDHWAGLRPGSPTGVPFIGPHPQVRDLFVCSGHFRTAVPIGPAAARLVTDLMLGRKPAVDPAPYAVGRDAEAALAD
jgi:glycine oxidase